MLQKKTGLILAGLAAYAAYKYSKMSADQKTSLMEKGKRLANQYLPDNLKNIFDSKTETAGETSNAFKTGF